MLPDQLLFSTPSNINRQILTQKSLQEKPQMYYIIQREAWLCAGVSVQDTSDTSGSLLVDVRVISNIVSGI